MNIQRREILTKIIEEQKKIISNIKESVYRYTKASNIESEPTQDAEDLSPEVDFKEMQKRFEKLLKDAELNLDILLLELKVEPSPIVQKGSILEAEKMLLFMGISIPKFTFNTKEIICISVNNPIYKSVEGKKEGDLFRLGSHEYTIVNIL